MPAAIAALLGVELRTRDPVRSLTQVLAPRRALLVLDSCELVLAAVATLAGAIGRDCPGVAILATSREPLRAAGETTWRLAPLAVPAADQPVGPADLAGHAATALFLDRARTAAPGFAPTAAEAAAIIGLCRRLDGIPLAIELAAARLDTMTVADLAARLDDRFRFLTDGRRTALPRHQTLRATLDWSYRTLPVEGAAVLRRVAIFAGGFTLEAAAAVAGTAAGTGGGAGAGAGDGSGAEAVADAIDGLVARSLVVLTRGDGTARYALLDTTRAYALEKCAESGEAAAAARAHAAFYAAMLAQARRDFARRPAEAWLATWRMEVDNIRVALDWAFSAAGDRGIGVALAAAAAGLMFDLGLLEASVQTAERALAAIVAAPQPDPRDELRLQAALGASLVYTRGPDAATAAAWARVLELATALGEGAFQVRALWGLWNAEVYGGSPRAALRFAARFAEAARALGHPTWELLGARLRGICHFYLGEQEAAERELAPLVAQYRRDVHRIQTVGFRVDHGIVGRANLARVLWVRGRPQQALAMARAALADAQAFDHAMTLQYVLTEGAIPLFLLAGDHAAARDATAMLLQAAPRHGFLIWEACGRCFDALLRARAGDAAAGLARVQESVAALRETRFAAPLGLVLGLQAECQADAGALAAAAATVEQALAHGATHEDRWNLAELWRIKGAIAARDGRTAAAEGHLGAALDWARRQGAASWALRAATDLAALRCRAGRPAAGRAVLEPFWRGFAEGFDLPDLVAAKAVLDACGA